MLHPLARNHGLINISELPPALLLSAVLAACPLVKLSWHADSRWSLQSQHPPPLERYSLSTGCSRNIQSAQAPPPRPCMHATMMMPRPYLATRVYRTRFRSRLTTDGCQYFFRYPCNNYKKQPGNEAKARPNNCGKNPSHFYITIIIIVVGFMAPEK